MVDKTIQTALLSLLRLGLWREQEADKVFSLSTGQWVELYRCAQEHTIEGIVYDGIQRLPHRLLPPRDLLLKWTVKIDQIERHNQQMNTCIKAQLKEFHEQDIHPILLKGQGVAGCYDIPKHRVCGDVDWYFDRKEDFRKANQMFRQKGINLSHTAGFSTEYMWKGIVIEHHTRMFDIHNPLCFGFLDRLQEKFRNQRLQRDLQGSMLLLPAPILMMLQVNVHILKHLLSFGIGIRQLCDAARVYHTYTSGVDGEELKRIYKRLGILKWIHLLHAVLVKFIGLPLNALPFNLAEKTNADWMMKEVWRTGNFGFFDSRFIDHEDQSGRSQPAGRIWSNVRRYVRFAPMEAISFPLVHFYSKFAAK